MRALKAVLIWLDKVFGRFPDPPRSRLSVQNENARAPAAIKSPIATAIEEIAAPVVADVDKPAAKPGPTPKYDVRFYSGSYRARQEAANRDGAACFLAHHFNSSTADEADYTLAIVALNASQASLQMADHYTDLVAENFGCPEWDDNPRDDRDGVHIGGFGRAGNSQIVHTTMPAMLVEPLFGSHVEHARIIRSEAGRQALAEILADTVVKFFPNGGLVAVSIGHKGKPQPHHLDRGAIISPAEFDDRPLMEADAAEDVLQRFKEVLEAV